MNKLLIAAKALVKKDISVIATKESKLPIPTSWACYQTALPTDEQLIEQFSHPLAKGLAVICGKISGNLEVIDVDVKYDLSGSLFNDLCVLIRESKPELLDRLLIIETKSGGYHIYYKCETIEGNQKLARRPATEDERKINPNDKVMVLIETRGQGGYVCAPPTEGYKKVSGEHIPEITTEERTLLLEICRSFNQYFTEQTKPPAARQTSEGYAVTPWEDYNIRGVDHMFTTLEKNGWIRKDNYSTSDKVRYKRPGTTESVISGDYCYSLNLFMVFTTSSVFEPEKGYRPAAVFAMLECEGDFSKAARKLSDLGYGEKKQSFGNKIERELFQKKLDGYTREDLIKVVQTKLKKSAEEAAEIYEAYEKQWGVSLCTFWEITGGKLSVSRFKLERFLFDVGGFALYFYDHNSNIYRIVRVVDGIVEVASTEQIKKFIKDYINSLPDTFDGGITPNDLLELVYKGSQAYFSDSFFEFLDRIDLDLLKDTVDEHYLPFRNGVVVVNSKDIVLKSYKEIGKVIWKTQVIDFNVCIDQTFDIELCEFFRFVKKVCGDDEERWLYAMTLIGYMLHTYKDPAKPYAVIIAEETEKEEDGGGTGKGIIVKALSYLINTERVDGKNFKLDKNFAFQRVGLDTRLVSIEDVRKNVDFEGFFSIITEGITVEKKNKDELYIPFKDSPKILFTTNYTISNTSKASLRRQKILELAPFFGPKYTPKDFFGHNLFDAWNEDEWNRFYNFMFACVNMYLSVGLREIENSEKMKRKHLKVNYGEEFLEWFDGYMLNGKESKKQLTDTYSMFLNENDFEKKDYTMKKFRNGINTGARLFGWEMRVVKNSAFGGKREFWLVKSGINTETEKNSGISTELEIN